jgi:hypothetical protein
MRLQPRRLIAPGPAICVERIRVARIDGTAHVDLPDPPIWESTSR